MIPASVAAATVACASADNMTSEAPKLDTLAELISPRLRGEGDGSATGGALRADKKAVGSGASNGDTRPRGRGRGRSGSECRLTITASPNACRPRIEKRNGAKERMSQRGAGG